MTDNPHIRRAYAAAAGRDAGQTAFLQALETLYESLEPALEEQPGWAEQLERLGEPERTVLFPVLWPDGRGRTRQARGFFIQYSTVLGPWQGGICFRRGLDLSSAKALALASALEYALAGLPAGGGLAGADADVRAMQDGESRRFCRGFMEGLYPLLPDAFSPALWAGQLPGREAARLAGSFRRLAALTGRAPAELAEGPMPRRQAVGWGLCILASLALRRQTGAHLEGQRILIAGRDGAAGWAGERAARMGARVVALGDGGGCLYAADGLPLATLRAIAEQPELPLLLWAIRAPGVEYRPGPGLWDIPADAVFLFDGARLDAAGARRLLDNRCAGLFEGTPGAATAAAARALAEGGALYVPAIAAGAGGAVMERRGGRNLSPWDADRLLRAAMGDIFRSLWDESLRIGCPGQLLRAAHIAAFRPLAAELACRDG